MTVPQFQVLHFIGLQIFNSQTRVDPIQGRKQAPSSPAAAVVWLFNDYHVQKNQTFLFYHVALQLYKVMLANVFCPAFRYEQINKFF